MPGRQAPSADEAATDPVLRRTLAAAGLPPTGRFAARGGWASRVWVGDEHVVRLSNGRARDTFRHEAAVVDLLTGCDVPHAQILAHGHGPDGPWCISERLPGRTVHEAWPTADPHARRSMIESLGSALHALHRVPVPDDLLPPWLSDALTGGAWPAFHPPVVSATLQQVDSARRLPGHDPRLLAEVAAWVQERLALFSTDQPVLVHGDVHGSNVIVEGGRVTGLIDLAEASAQPADVELDTILRWCARAREYPPTPGAPGLEEAALSLVPRWLRGAYPELFGREHLRERLLFYDMHVELALYAHHPQPDAREQARGHIAHLLTGHGHLDRLTW